MMGWGMGRGGTQREQRDVKRAGGCTRRLALGWAGLATAGVLGACAGPAPPVPTASARAQRTIRFAAGGNATEAPLWGEVSSAYNALETGLSVRFEPCTAGTGAGVDCLPGYLAQLVAGTAPDVWRVDDEPLPFYVDRSMYHELDDLFARDAREMNPADFFPRSIAAFRYDRAASRHGQGRLYAVPFNTGGDMLWFNRQLFLEAGVAPPPADGGWTAEQWLDLARKTSAFEGEAMTTAGLASRPAFRNNLGLLWMAGAKLRDNSGQRWTFTIPETVQAYEWLVALRTRHRVVPGPSDFPGLGNPFLAGRAAMWSAFASSRPDILARPDTLPDWDVTVYPKAPDGERYTRETSDGVGLPARPRQPEDGWAFVKYLASIEGMRLQARLGRAVPARRSVANSPDYVRPDTPQHEENLVRTLEFSRPQPVTPMFVEAERIVRRYEDVMFDPAAALPPSRALPQLQAVLDRLERDRAVPADWEPRV
jgi:ABC-type glycerol-3-phosphate transport system substrate-binding protein